MKPSDCLMAAEIAIEAGEVPFFWGTYGGGKSQGTFQLAQKLGRTLYQVRTSLIDTVDLRGCPVVVTNPDGTSWQTKWGYPGFLPDKPGCLIFLDELNSGLTQVQTCCYQLVQEKSVGEHNLPPDTAVMGAGNRESDGGVTHRMPEPLADRMVHLEWDLDVGDWVTWALANGIRTDIVAFVRFRPRLLHQQWIDADAKAAANGQRLPKQSKEGAKKAGPSPRSYEKLSNLVTQCEIRQAAPEVEYGLVTGKIGISTGTEYLAFRRMAAKLVTFEQIMASPLTCPVPDPGDKSGPSALYAITMMMAARVNNKTLPAVMQYAQRLPGDFQVVLVDDIKRKSPDLDNTRCLIEWKAKNADVYR